MENGLGELYGALAAARLEFGALTKTKTANTGSYSYSYADLADVIEATAAAMAKQGLVIIQEPEVITENGRSMVIIHGCIAHKSGAIHKLQSLPMPVAGNDAQKIGSAISYGRRYQISAALNLAAEDDDGKEATGERPQAQRQSQPQTQRQTQPAEQPQHRNNAVGKPAETKAQATQEPATQDELDVIGTWQGPMDAQVWAYNIGACQNEHHARESWASSVKACGGYSPRNKEMVMLHFLRHQYEKLGETLADPIPN